MKLSKCLFRHDWSEWKITHESEIMSRISNTVISLVIVQQKCCKRCHLQKARTERINLL